MIRWNEMKQNMFKQTLHLSLSGPFISEKENLLLLLVK